MDKKRSSSGSGPLPVSPVAGVKRPAPSLLPAFEPTSPSCLPRPTKRRALVSPGHGNHKKQKYPTPVPTSSTGIASSPPPPEPRPLRPALGRTPSAIAGRPPLATVESVLLRRDGRPALLGRSSSSANYQLSTNKNISRVHVRAVYIAADPPTSHKVQVECLGWNGLKVHCEGKVLELRKGDIFTSVIEDAEIMIDVHGTRVFVRWPPKLATPTDSESAWHDEHSPRRASAAGLPSPNQSPLRHQHRMQSPVSPTPVGHATTNANSTLLTPDPSLPAVIHVYEDEQSGDEMDRTLPGQATQSTQRASQPLSTNLLASQSGAVSLLSEFSDADEENDPIVHSFGPYGENLMPRLEAITAGSPERRRPLEPIKEATASPQSRSFDAVKDDASNPIINHLVNQLAYSRLSSTPLSTLMEHLPPRLRFTSPGSKENEDLSLETLKRLLNAIPCIGEVSREGKDASGKALESEYHYIPEMDLDEDRRNAIVGELKKPGLRACRKQHKQYFWRKLK